MKDWEKRFDKEFGYLSVAIDYYVENAYPLRKESGMKHLRDLKHFLATALEEQRASMIAEIESWLVDEEVHELENASWDEMRQQASKIGRNELRAELRTKLNQLKGSDANL